MRNTITCCYRKIIFYMNDQMTNFVLVIAYHYVSGYITPPKHWLFYDNCMSCCFIIVFLTDFKILLLSLQKVFCKDYFGNGTIDPKQWRNSPLSFLFFRQVWDLGTLLCSRAIQAEVKKSTKDDDDDESRPLLNVLHWAWPI